VPHSNFIGLEEFKTRARDGNAAGLAIRKQYTAEIKAEDEPEERVLHVVISTGALDRDNDTIAPKGWDLKDYKKNPVVLWAHDYWNPPIAKTRKVWVENDQLKAIAEFTAEDVYPFGYMIYRMCKEKFLNAASVGFRPKEYKVRTDEDEHGYGWDFLKQILLEYSIVPVPSNPEALIEARSMGIDLAPMREWAEKVLDGELGESGIWVPRKAVEGIVKLLETGKTISAPGQGAETKSDKMRTPMNLLADLDILRTHGGPEFVDEESDSGSAPPEKADEPEEPVVELDDEPPADGEEPKKSEDSEQETAPAETAGPEKAGESATPGPTAGPDEAPAGQPKTPSGRPDNLSEQPKTPSAQPEEEASKETLAGGEPRSDAPDADLATLKSEIAEIKELVKQLVGQRSPDKPEEEADEKSAGGKPEDIKSAADGDEVVLVLVDEPEPAKEAEVKGDVIEFADGVDVAQVIGDTIRSAFNQARGRVD